MKEFIFFKKMLFPAIVQLIFWFFALICVFTGIYGLFHHDIWTGLGVLILGPLFVRVGCEYLIVLFQINNTLTEIRDHLKANCSPKQSV